MLCCASLFSQLVVVFSKGQFDHSVKTYRVELVMRGSNVMQGYWNDPDPNAGVLRLGL